MVVCVFRFMLLVGDCSVGEFDCKPCSLREFLCRSVGLAGEVGSPIFPAGLVERQVDRWCFR